MELELEPYTGDAKVLNTMGFYPCFNGIRVGTLVLFYYSLHNLQVSILVLMELELERRM